MAIYLYRLGRLAARRAWAVILTWLLLLAIAGGAAFTLQKPFTKQLSIPGTEFQQVLNDLEASLPEAAGGTSGVVFSTKDGQKFTAEQKKAVADTIDEWKKIDGVEDATDPFATQHDLDKARTDIADGRTKLADGEKEVVDNQKKIDDGKKELADGQKKLNSGEAEIIDGEKKLAMGQAQVADGKTEIAANAEKLAKGRAELDAGQAKIDAGRVQLSDARDELAAGQAEIDKNAAKIAAGKQQLDAARAQVEAGEAQIAPARKQLAEGEEKLAAAQAEVTQGRAQVDAGRRQVEAGMAQITGGLAQLDQQAAGIVPGTPEADAALAAIEQQRTALMAQQAELQETTATLDATEAQLAAGQKELDTEAAKLAAGKKELEQKSAPLVEARRTLDEKTAELDAGERKLAEGQAKLDAGKATIEEKSAELAQGQKKISDGRAELSAGQAKLDAGRAKLDEGQAEIDANRAKLDAGKAGIASGRIDAAAAARQLTEGQAKLNDARTTIAEKKVELRRGERRMALMDGLRTVNTGGNVAITNVSFTLPMNEVPAETKDKLPAEATDLAALGVNVDYSKEIVENIELGGISEVVGVVVAAIILIVMLGSLLAAGLPLLTALVGLSVGMLTMLALTHWVEMSDVTPALAIMLGLAVGIDYALFIVHRHRENLARGDLDLHESIGRATGTAGSAVLFAGMTVVVALAALTLTGIPFLGVMGLAAAGTVTCAVLVALTLTPALLALIGPRVLSRRSRQALARKLEDEESEAAAADAEEMQAHHTPHGRGWGGLVTRFPVIAIVGSILLLGTLAIPAASLRLGLPDASQEPPESTAYRTYSLVGEAFGEGQNAAILAVAKVDKNEARRMTDDQVTDLQLTVAEQLKDHANVEYVVPAAASDDHRTLIFQIVPGTGPNDDATRDLITSLRTDRTEIMDATPVDSIGFAGQTVANIDMSEILSKALPLYLGVVVGISILLLLLVFRSLLVPLLATGGFLLSVAASFGAVVAVYQWGWLGSLFGVANPGVILSFLPTLVIGILFGLAMDYQMFLVSGMREAWAHGHTARTAVRTGFSHGARVVTAAALIMTGVFASFIYSPMQMIKPIGFALAVGVLLDAFVVRMTIMPAIMHLLGERAWYLPGWLQRIVPDLDVEGTKLVEMREAETRAAREREAEMTTAETREFESAPVEPN